MGRDESAAACFAEVKDRPVTPPKICLFRPAHTPGVRTKAPGVAPYAVDEARVFGKLSNTTGVAAPTAAGAMTYDPPASDTLLGAGAKEDRHPIGKGVCKSTHLPDTLPGDFTFGRFMGKSEETAGSAISPTRAPISSPDSAGFSSSTGGGGAKKPRELYSPHSVPVVGERSASQLDWSRVRLDTTTHTFGAASRKGSPGATLAAEAEKARTRGAGASATAPYATSTNDASAAGSSVVPLVSVRCIDPVYVSGD